MRELQFPLSPQRTKKGCKYYAYNLFFVYISYRKLNATDMKKQVITSIALSLLVISCCKKRHTTPVIDSTAVDSIAVVDTIAIDSVIVDCDLSFEQAINGSKAPQEIIDQLDLLTVQYYSTDGKIHQGQILCNKAISEDIVYLFEFMKEQQFPIAKVIPISEYGWNDEASMQDNNTSCFNYRNIDYSLHAKGVAIDINPYLNPMIWKPGKKRINKPVGAIYNPDSLGTLTDSSEVVLEFKNRDFYWGGNFKDKYDYQHFHKKGYPLPRKAKTDSVKPKEKVVESNGSLKSLPLSMIKNYFRALGYYDQRYVEEWILSKSQETGGKAFSINLLDNTITPKTFNTKEIRYPIGYAKNSITKVLENNNLNPDYIYKADLNIQIMNDTVYCSAIVVDVNDNEYSYESYKIKPKR